jgi:hypothetical protein
MTECGGSTLRTSSTVSFKADPMGIYNSGERIENHKISTKKESQKVNMRNRSFVFINKKNLDEERKLRRS